MQAIDVRIALSPGAQAVEDIAIQCLARLILELGKAGQRDGDCVSKIGAADSTFLIQMTRAGNRIEAAVMLESEIGTLLTPVEQERLAADMAGVPDLRGDDREEA